MPSAMASALAFAITSTIALGWIQPFANQLLLAFGVDFLARAPEKATDSILLWLNAVLTQEI
jgi:hypothetical protein